MPALTHEFAPISVRLPGANAVMSDIPVGLFTSPPSLDVDHEQLTRIAHYTHEGKSVTFEIVNKPAASAELNPAVTEVDPVPDNTFKGLLKAIFSSRVSRKTRREKANHSSTASTV